MERLDGQPRAAAVLQQRGLPVLLVELSAAVELSRLDPDGLGRAGAGLGAARLDHRGAGGGRRPRSGRATHLRAIPRPPAPARPPPSLPLPLSPHPPLPPSPPPL